MEAGKSRRSDRVLLLGRPSHVKTGDAEVLPIPARRVVRYVVPICGTFSVAILASVLIIVGNQVSGMLRVSAEAGELQGMYDSVADVWLGVPYGRAPTRWAPPVTFAWTGILDASRYGPVCPQGAAFGIDLTSQPASETECLLLNIHAPHGVAGAAANGGAGFVPKPVLVFLHGGDFVVGSSSQPLYNASTLSAQADVVVVVVQFRLGAFGFLSHPAIQASRGFSGNFGLLDQKLALSWVFQNIQSFGGDPSQVTLWGQGSGGISAITQISMQDSTNFFQSLLLQSVSPAALPTMEALFPDGELFASQLGCSPGPDGPSSAKVLDCMNKASAKAIVSASMMPAFRWTPVVDRMHIRYQAMTLIKNQEFITSTVPGGVLLGMGANDTTALLSYLLGPQPPVTSITALQFYSSVNSIFATASKPALIASFYAQLYGVPPSDSPAANVSSVVNFQALAQAVTDGAVLCPSATLLGAFNTSGLASWMYQLADPLSFVDPVLGASHYQDLALAFGQPCFVSCSNDQGQFTPQEQALSARFMRSLGTFARRTSLVQTPRGISNWFPFGSTPDLPDALVRLAPVVSAQGSVFDSPDSCRQLWSLQNWPIFE
jgi:carboxylesterase type B